MINLNGNIHIQEKSILKFRSDDMRRKVKDYHVSVYEHFPIFKWKKCNCCGEEVKLEKIYEVIFYNDVYCNYQKPFFICKKCAINKINTTPAFDRIIPKLLVKYYEGTEEFKKFKETSNVII